MEKFLKQMMAEMIKDNPVLLKYEPWLQYTTKADIEAARNREFVRKAIIWFSVEKIPVTGDLSKKYTSPDVAVELVYQAAENDPDFDKALDTVAAKFLELFPCQ